MHDAWYDTDAAAQSQVPMTRLDLARLHQAGRIHARTFVRHADWTGWQSLNDVVASPGIVIAGPPLHANTPAPRRGQSGCGIAAIMAAVISVSAYQAYTQRAALSRVIVISAPARPTSRRRSSRQARAPQMRPTRPHYQQMRRYTTRCAGMPQAPR